jgi:hypothetical protein
LQSLANPHYKLLNDVRWSAEHIGDVALYKLEALIAACYDFSERFRRIEIWHFASIFTLHFRGTESR